jgi:hypothetical protein
MATDPGRVQATGSGSRIPVSVDLSELDRLIEQSQAGIVEHDGFTRHDLELHKGWKRCRAQDWINSQLKAGTVRHIGKRPGSGGKVYEIVR